jgi:hypothetical protein
LARRDRVRTRTSNGIVNQASAKLVCHNLCVVHQSHVELGIETVFWQDERNEPADVLPVVRPG